MKTITARAWDIALLAALWLLVITGAAKAQPATQPVSEKAQYLRDLADYVQGNETLLVELYDKVARYETMLAGAAEVYTDGTNLRPNTVYRLPENGIPLAVKVEQSGVVFFGGRAWAKDENPAIDVRKGVRGVKVLGVTWGNPEAPPVPGKRGVGPAVRDRGHDTRVEGNTVEECDSFVIATDDSTGLAVVGNDVPNLIGSYFFYVDGTATRFTVTHNEVLRGSRVENVVRASPSQGKIPTRGVFTHNKIVANKKACIDLRQIIGATVQFNELVNEHETKPDGRPGKSGTCFSVGPGGSIGINVPDPLNERATGIVFANNVCRGGVVRIIPGTANVKVLENEGYGLRPNVDPFVLIDGKGDDAPSMVVAYPEVVGNVAYVPGLTNKPVIHWTDSDVVVGAVERGNRWEQGIPQ